MRTLPERPVFYSSSNFWLILDLGRGKLMPQWGTMRSISLFSAPKLIHPPVIHGVMQTNLHNWATKEQQQKHHQNLPGSNCSAENCVTFVQNSNKDLHGTSTAKGRKMPKLLPNRKSRNLGACPVFLTRILCCCRLCPSSKAKGTQGILHLPEIPGEFFDG